MPFFLSKEICKEFFYVTRKQFYQAIDYFSSILICYEVHSFAAISQTYPFLQIKDCCCLPLDHSYLWRSQEHVWIHVFSKQGNKSTSRLHNEFLNYPTQIIHTACLDSSFQPLALKSEVDLFLSSVFEARMPGGSGAGDQQPCFETKLPWFI